MPINIPDGLPAKKILHEERIFALEEEVAERQEIRPLRVAILNLMPTKIETETQILRLISKSPLQVSCDFMRVSTHEATHVSQDHLVKFYDTFDSFADKNYDGLIITGAPVEKIDFEDVEYWPELVQYFEWARSHVFSVLHYCWGAQAGLYYYYNIPKIMLPKKLYGIYPYGLTTNFHPLLRGFDDRYFIPQSRYTRVDDNKIDADPRLEVLSRSAENGINICSTSDMRHIFVMGHFEYDRNSLQDEFIRDKNKGLDPEQPKFYYPDNDSSEQPCFKWCSYAHLFYTNWVNMVYQETPYDLLQLTRKE